MVLVGSVDEQRKGCGALFLRFVQVVIIDIFILMAIESYLNVSFNVVYCFAIISISVNFSK